MMTKKRNFVYTFLLFAFLLAGFNSQAQQIVINEDPDISSLMEKYISWGKEEGTINGWRIQIINTDDRRRMEKDLSDFRYYFPEVKYVNWKQVSPYYKVIIGAYETKPDVLAFLQKVKEKFPSAIPVVEKINEKELLGMQ